MRVFVSSLDVQVEMFYLNHGRVPEHPHKKAARHLETVPQQAINGVYIHLWHLDFEKDSKNGSPLSIL